MKEFYTKIYNKLKEVPKGKLTTYKELADAIGSKAYRAVGTAMKKNPYSPKVPCHRVVNSDGSIGHFSKGIMAKIKLLNSEGIPIKNNKIENFQKYLYRFSH